MGSGSTLVVGAAAEADSVGRGGNEGHVKAKGQKGQKSDCDQKSFNIALRVNKPRFCGEREKVCLVICVYGVFV